MRRVLKFLTVEFLYNGHLQSLGLTSIVFISSFLILGRLASFDILLTVYLLFEIVYLFDRYKYIDIDKITNPERTSHLQKYLDKIPVIMAGIFVLLALLLFNFSNVTSIFFAFTVLIFGLLYPLYFKRLTHKIPLFKNVYVSLVHSLMVFFPSVYYSIMLPNLYISLVLSGLVFWGSMMSQIVLDTKDIVADKLNKLLTFPILVDRKRITKILMILSILVGSFFMFIAIISRNHLLLYLAFENIFIDLVLIRLISDSKKLSLFLAGGRFIIWTCLILMPWKFGVRVTE